MRALVRPRTETSGRDVPFDFSDQAGISPGLAQISDTQLLSLSVTCRWNTQDEFDTFPLELHERVSQELKRVLTDFGQVIAITSACLFMGRVADMSFVKRVEVQLEQFGRILAVVFGVANESPAFQLASAHVICERRRVFVVVLIGWFTWPFLYVLGVRPVWSVAVRDGFRMSGLVIEVESQASLTCASHTKIHSDHKIGLPCVGRHYSESVSKIAL